MALEIYRNMANSQKRFQGHVVAFREVTRENLERGGAFCDDNKICNSPKTKLMA